MKSFDFYEFTGILLPGSIVLIGLSYFFVEFQEIILSNDVSLGNFGIFVLLAYPTGHLIQSIGNLLENIWWYFWGGMPTNWVLKKKTSYLTQSQKQSIQYLSNKIITPNEEIDINIIDKNDWFNLTRQIYSKLFALGKTQRIDIFNGNYGLNRGISASILSLILIMPFSNKFQWQLLCFFLIIFLISLYRMHRFARHYARELFMQFLNVGNDSNNRNK